MVMDLQDVTHTLADKLSQSHIRLFGSSAAPLQVIDLDNAVESGDEDSQDEGDWSEEDEEDGVLDSDAESESGPLTSGSRSVGDRGRTTPRNPRSVNRLPASGAETTNVEYAESDSDLGDGLGNDIGQSADEGASDVEDEDEDEEGVEEDGGEDAPRWKSNLAVRASHSFAQNSRRRKDWTKLIYSSDQSAQEVVFGKSSGSADAKGLGGEEEEEELFTIKHSDVLAEETFDQTKEPVDVQALEVWEDEEMLDSIRHLFITGEPKASNATTQGEPYEDDAEGGFEDLEAPANPAPPKPEDDLAAKKELLKRKFDEQYDDPDEDPTASMDFYDQKKDELVRQQQLNRAEFEGVDEETRLLVEGHRAGAYVRVELENVPCELIEHFDPAFPIIVGGLLPAEERFGFVQVRIKRHRWYTRTLKTNDPLIFSIGWRRFQSLPIYSLDDHSIRMRMLKYTPEHMHCYATFYGPVSLPGTGFCAFNSLEGSVPGFRVSASGVVLDIDRSTKIVKKLKLTGTPYKIFKNTAFVKDMFNSALEVVKFEGANIKTVSGIRGQIKKAQAKPDGAFRATFEDKVLMSGTSKYPSRWQCSKLTKYYLPRYCFLASMVFDPTTQVLQSRDFTVAGRQGQVARNASDWTSSPSRESENSSKHQLDLQSERHIVIRQSYPCSFHFFSPWIDLRGASTHSRYPVNSRPDSHMLPKSKPQDHSPTQPICKSALLCLNRKSAKRLASSSRFERFVETKSLGGAKSKTSVRRHIAKRPKWRSRRRSISARRNGRSICGLLDKKQSELQTMVAAEARKSAELIEYVLLFGLL
jgi:ribosome biogenesis protein BMS1